MFVIIKNELIKAFKSKAIRSAFIVFGLVTLLLSPIMLCGDQVVTRMYVPIYILYCFSIMCIFSVFSCLGGYILGVEFKLGTLKIIKAKQLADWKFIMAKVIVAVMYVTLITGEIVAIAMLISLFYPAGDVAIIREGINMSHIEAKQLLLKMIGLLLLGNIYTIMLTMLVISLIKKLELGVLLSIIIMFFSMVAAILIKGAFINYVLPINNFDCLGIFFIKDINIWKVALQRIVYSLIFLIGTIILYRRMQLE